MSTSVAADPAGAGRSIPRNPIARYLRWLHLQWPAGTVEKLPEVQPDGSTNVPGLYVVGDLTGVPLLKFSSDSGARAVQTILADPLLPGPSDRGGGPRPRHRRRRRLGHGGGPRGPEAGAAIRAPRGDRALLHDRQLPEGQADLHLPDGHDPRRRAAVHGALRGQGGAPRGAARDDDRERDRAAPGPGRARAPARAGCSRCTSRAATSSAPIA